MGLKQIGIDYLQSWQNNYRAYPFLHEEMGAALRSADLVVSRSGASILGEYPIFELPAILVPYPHAWQYQKTNAKYLVDRDAAMMIRDEELKERLLTRSVITDQGSGEIRSNEICPEGDGETRGGKDDCPRADLFGPK